MKLTIAQVARILSDNYDHLRWMKEVNVCCEKMALELFGGKLLDYRFNDDVREDVVNVISYNDGDDFGELQSIEFCPFCGEQITYTREDV